MTATLIAAAIFGAMVFGALGSLMLAKPAPIPVRVTKTRK